MFKSFVISLPDAEVRRDYIRAMLRQHGLDFEFFDAVDGRAMDALSSPSYGGVKRRLFFGRDMSAGEIGICLSSINLYQKMVDEGIKHALVLEDDAALYDDFKDVLDALLHGPQDFDVVRFLGKDKVVKYQQHTKRSLFGDYKLQRLRQSTGGAYAYLITLDGARKMLHLMKSFYMPVDIVMGHQSLNSFVVWPAVAYVDEALDNDSQIGDERFDKSAGRSGALKIVYPFTRGGFKVFHACTRVIYYWIKRIKDHS